MDTEYLMQHPTSMPVQEAAMTYLFLYEPPILRVVPPLAPDVDTLDEHEEERLLACGA